MDWKKSTDGVLVFMLFVLRMSILDSMLSSPTLVSERKRAVIQIKLDAAKSKKELHTTTSNSNNDPSA